MTTAEIREAFLAFFEKNDHKRLESAPLVPRDDPTLLFVNAGMVPFKNDFVGITTPSSKRATTSQRCLRVSGKHNDLEEVGRTPRHHTLFEMLGNFSFGDYFKERAIELAYAFLIEELGLDASRIKYTVFEGDKTAPPDEEAAEIWKRVAGVGDDAVLPFGAKDNFWAMGDTGPCGPCTEIHYDLGPDLEGEVNDGDRWMEIWNLVFMQYVRGDDGKLAPLPAPSIDTGMGLERIASVVQGKKSNYEIDLFAGLLDRISQVVGRPYEGGDRSDSVSMRVIADHARATAFLLADDVHPDKTGRGYVLRKIMRRAISHAVLLGVDKPFLADVAEGVAEIMGDAHPVLRERLSSIRTGAESEEKLFRRTVEQGIKRIDELLSQLEDDTVWTTGADGGRVLSGDTAFRLYDTWGTPLELTASVGVRRGFEIDEPGFFAAMEVQKERSRASWKGGASGGQALESFATTVRAEHGATRFSGYDATDGESEVVGLAVVKDAEIEPVSSAGEGAMVALVTSSTPFYGESGGQIGDTGTLELPGARVRIEDTQKASGGEVFLHLGTIEEGELGVGERARQAVDSNRRRAIMANHSATHLAHYALRDVLGPHVQQKGSYVGPDRLRFDFSHSKGLTPSELESIESLVNDLARGNHAVETRVLPYTKAIEAGALAFFGDKYGDEVRMVSMGPSKELCGGTHVPRTGDLGLFTFASEGSVASGVRRIEALVGGAAQERLRELRSRLHEAADRLKTAPESLGDRIDDLLDENKRLKRKVAELEKASASGAADDLASTARDVAGHRVIVGPAPVDNRDTLRDLGDSLRSSGASTVVVLGTALEGKVALVAAVSDDVVKGGKLKAGDLVGRVARIAGGGGGGKPHLATAGAKDPSKLQEALDAVPSIVSEMLS